VTGTSPHGQEESDGNWLADSHRSFLVGLGQFIDPDAGLQEITVLYGGHARLLDALDSSIDTEAGLAGILPRSAAATTEPAPSVQPHTGQREAATDRRHDRSLGILGIDLGTAYCRVARIDDHTGSPVAITDADGTSLTPSAVYFESPRRAIVGRAAVDEASFFPALVAQRVKRDMGTWTAYEFHGQQHTPETVSALILRELAQAAEGETGQPARNVVITVPASFGVAEREATRKAGELAGLNVLDLLAEPVAAALHYQATTGKDAGVRHILVYALGAGAFDTTVIRLDGDDITVVCTDGDPRLGGADWDEAITGYLVEQFAAEHPGISPHDDASFMLDLRKVAEDLKQTLTEAHSWRHTMRYRGAVTQVEITRDTLEQLTADLLDRTAAMTQRAIATARGKGITGFDSVLLVGGMTRMPAVTRELGRLGLTAWLSEPDLAVAKGAALYALTRTIRPAGVQTAGLRSAEDVAVSTGLTVAEVEELARKRVTTVLSRAFGVMSLDGRDPLALTDPMRARKMIMHLLSANTPLPENTGPFTFHTATDNQRTVAIEVWEQAGEVESDDPADNRKIGQGMLKIPPRLPAQSPLEVTFYMSETGLLTVRAVEPGSGMDLQFDLQIGDLDQAGMDEARRSVASYTIG
jgi:molecular chaperone DnaK